LRNDRLRPLPENYRLPFFPVHSLAMALDDPEDMPSIERAVGVAERAVNESEAIKARVTLAKWGEARRRDLGPWWDAAQSAGKNPGTLPDRAADKTPKQANVTYVDYTDDTLAARAALGLKDIPAATLAKPAQPPP
jgi:hypothetical protein